MSQKKLISKNKTKKLLKHKRKNLLYDTFWKIIISKNIKRVFGLPGSPLDNLLSSKPKKIAWTNTGNELSNGFMSQVYGQYTNNVGYLFVTTGPGIATTISALEQAIYEGNPLVIVSPIESNAHKGSFQNWDIKNVSKHLTKYVFCINHKSNIVSNIQKSYEIAKKYNTGVILLFETNVFTTQLYKAPLIYNDETSIWIHNQKMRKTILLKNLEKMNSTNMLLVVGKLKLNDYKALFKFIKINNLPFVTTSKGRFSTNGLGIECGRVGILGKHSANYAMYNANHLLILGNISGLLNEPYKSRFSVMFTENKKVYSLCYDKTQTIRSPNIYEMNNLSFILNDLYISVNEDWMKKLQHSNLLLNVDLPRISKLEKYIYIAANIYKSNKLKIPVATGVGNHWYGIAKYMDIEEPNCFESSTVWASIGIGIANGIAMYYAINKPVWVFEGDGGTLFASTDLLYLLNNPQLPITVTIYVNNIYGAIFEDYEKRVDKMNEVVDVPNIPILKILPNCHIFNSEEKYFKYLNNHLISNKSRFIIILIPNKLDSNDIYGINADYEYQENLKKDKFDNILKTKMIL
jgi:acetolactate synthase-1/2/3 large subunit